MTEEKQRSRYYVRSVQRALGILNCFSDASPYLGVSEIAQKIGVHKSTIHALLVTLEDEGYVIKDLDRNKYCLTYQLFKLGAIVSENIGIGRIARPHMQKLCEKTGESVALSIRDGTRRLVLEVVENPVPVKLYLRPGQQLHLHASAAGKILLCELAHQEIEEIIAKEGLPQITPNTVCNYETLKTELLSVRNQGFALCNGEGYWDAGSVGAPIRDYTGKIIACVTIYGPIQHYKNESLHEYIVNTCACADNISIAMGYKASMNANV